MKTQHSTLSTFWLGLSLSVLLLGSLGCLTDIFSSCDDSYDCASDEYCNENGRCEADWPFGQDELEQGGEVESLETLEPDTDVEEGEREPNASYPHDSIS